MIQESKGGLPADYTPAYYNFPGNVAGAFSGMPQYCILHGSRGGHRISVDEEFRGTAQYAMHEPNGLGWNVTVGNDAVAEHIPPDRWGWHARACSPHSLSCEFAQPLEEYDITDAQVRAFCWWMREIVFKRWPEFRAWIMVDPTHALPTHAEVEVWGWTGAHDGKTDAFSDGSARTTDLRNRILALL